jgi:hypothetical protein
MEIGMIFITGRNKREWFNAYAAYIQLRTSCEVN